jgi:hypothetical protein
MAPASSVLKHIYDRTSKGLMFDPARKDNTYVGDDVSTDTSRPKIEDIMKETAGGNGKGIAGSIGPYKDLWKEPKDE